LICSGVISFHPLSRNQRTGFSRRPNTARRTEGKVGGFLFAVAVAVGLPRAFSSWH